jgi:hypothetical protein
MLVSRSFIRVSIFPLPVSNWSIVLIPAAFSKNLLFINSRSDFILSTSTIALSILSRKALGSCAIS